MKAFELVKINRESMELMSRLDLKSADYQYISLYDEYLILRRGRQKYWYVITYLSEKYGISESTVKRLVRKFSREVDL
jgi:hypothetical protein